MKEQFVAPDLRQLQGAGKLRPLPAHVDGEEAVGADDEQCRAIRLDQVGLVDALLLHVRRRVIHARGRHPAPLGRLDHRGGPALLTTEPPRPNERQCVLLRVGKQVAARAERLQARSRAARRRAPRRRRASPAGCEQRQREGSHQGEECGVPFHLTRYTSRRVRNVTPRRRCRRCCRSRDARGGGEAEPSFRSGHRVSVALCVCRAG